MVLEYLAEAGRVPAPDWMIEYATALARLHSATGPDDAGALPAWTGPGRADARAFVSLAERLGVPVPASLTASLDGMVERLNAAGHHALLHGDPCPDNAMRTDSGIMFVDLEQASLGGPGQLGHARPDAGVVAQCPGASGRRRRSAAPLLTERGLVIGPDCGGEAVEVAAAEEAGPVDGDDGEIGG
jgi:hypothetical protein